MSTGTHYRPAQFGNTLTRQVLYRDHRTTVKAVKKNSMSTKIP